MIEKPKRSFKELVTAAWARKKTTIPVALLVVLAGLTAVPATRYFLPGLVFKKSVSFIVQDTVSQSRISEADVLIDGQLLKSDQTGVVKAYGIRPGYKTVVINKLFYVDYKVKILVTLFKTNKQTVFNVQPKGRPTKVTVKNRLSGQLLAGVLVKTEQGSQGKTSSDGTATVVLPSDKTEVKGTISGDAVVTADVTIRAAQDDHTNVFPATPIGRLYFLSKAGGNIDVVKTNLDGTDRQTVLAGTGQEDDTDTILLASKDWKHLALKSRRDSALPKLYLIETATDKLSTMDEGNVTFTLNGWSGQSFIYNIDRGGVQQWQNKRQALKSFNATTRQLLTLDETSGEGSSYLDYAGETLQTTYILKDQILYTKTWYASYYYGTRLANKKMVVAVVKPDGSGKKTLKDWQAGYNASLTSAYTGPDQLYFYVVLDGVQTSYWEYQDGNVAQATDIGAESFNKAYPTYIESPNGNSSLWSEARDGKNALFVGDTSGKNSKKIATLTELVPYGWYSDDYILVSKSSSELYIMGRDGIKPGDVPTKVSDYHKPNYSFGGYGKGYGGF